MDRFRWIPTEGDKGDLETPGGQVFASDITLTEAGELLLDTTAVIVRAMARIDYSVN